jgi:hypothetical protein
MTVKSLRKQLAAAIAMTLVATVALGSSTYAWFVNNSIVEAKDTELTATTAEYLLISDDNTAFGTTMTLAAATSGAVLTPVSTTNATVGTFYKVKENAEEAWKASSNITKANKFEAATIDTDYYHDELWLKSSAANAEVKLNINVTNTDSSKNIEEAIYVAFVPKGTPDTNYKTMVYQLSGANTHSITAGANTFVGDTNTGNYTTSGVKSIQTDGTLTASDKGALTITNTSGATTALAFNTLATAGTSYGYDVYVWMEGTDPQCYNDIASTSTVSQKIKVNFEFYTGDFQTNHP